MKKTVTVLMILCFLLCLVSCGNKVPVVDDKGGRNALIDEENKESIDLNRLMPIAVFEMENGIAFEIELYRDIAPLTVSNFVKLAQKGFYDGTIIHRITKSGIFVIQGGGYYIEGDEEKQKTADSIYGEFTSNGFINNLSHDEGIISMARMGGMNDSASSQFFICYAESKSLDGDYAAFGKVRKNIEAVKSISAEQCNGEKPINNIIIKKVFIKYEEK